MTSPPQSQSPLRVVPPTPDAPKPAPNPAPSPPQPEAAEPAATAKPETQHSRQGWLRVGAVVLVLGAVGFIPLGNRVKADAVIKDRENDRQRVTMSHGADGPVEFHVESGDSVEVGDKLVTINNPQLRDRIREAEQNIERTQGQLRQAEIELGRARRELDSAREKEEQAERRLERKNRELQRLIDGSSPESQQFEEDSFSIESEREAIYDEIRGLEFRIEGLQTRHDTIEGNLSNLVDDLQYAKQREADLKQLVDDGNFGRSHREVSNARQERSRLEQDIRDRRGEQEEINTQIQEIRSEIRNLENRAQGRRHQRQGLDAQRLGLIETYEQEQQDLEDRYYQQQNERQILDTTVERAIQNVENNQTDLVALEDELEHLKQQQQENTIAARTSGVVITDDIDLLNNQSFAPGAELLHIANPRNLQVVAYVSQGDINLVEKSQSVDLYLDGQPNFHREATIKDTNPHFTEDELQPVLQVTFTIDNPEKKALIGAEGYVKIETEKRNLYQKMYHQFSKLIDSKRYLP